MARIHVNIFFHDGTETFELSQTPSMLSDIIKTIGESDYA
jgi:hypothetical protein